MRAPDRKTLLILLLATTTLVSGLLAWDARRQLVEARRAPTLQVTRTEIVTTAAPAPLVTPAPAEAPPAPVAAPTPAARPPEDDGPPGPGFGRGFGGGPGGGRFAAQFAELMQDPDFAAAWKIQQEARVERRYAELFSHLNLGPEQAAALKTLLAERENAGRDVFASAAAQGMNPRENRDQLRQLAADLQAEVDATIAAQFGPSVTQALGEHEASAPQRSAVNDFNERLLTRGQTLTSLQTRQLTNILAETGQRVGRDILVTEETIRRASSVLSPSQIADLTRLRAEQQARQVIDAKFRAAREDRRD